MLMGWLEIFFNSYHVISVNQWFNRTLMYSSFLFSVLYSPAVLQKRCPNPCLFISLCRGFRFPISSMWLVCFLQSKFNMESHILTFELFAPKKIMCTHISNPGASKSTNLKTFHSIYTFWFPCDKFKVLKQEQQQKQINELRTILKHECAEFTAKSPKVWPFLINSHFLMHAGYPRVRN